jgi:hypothetical protein
VINPSFIILNNKYSPLLIYLPLIIGQTSIQLKFNKKTI